MLKLLYKTLLVSVLSGSLLMLNFNFNVSTLNVNMNSVQAETVKTEGIGDGDLMSTLTMTSVGLIASRLFTYKMTTDVMIAAAGGAAFIAGEILATFKLKKVIKDMETEIKRDDKGVIDQKQIEILEKLRESYVKAKDTANTKKNLQMAAAAAFAAAAITAVVLKSSETLAFEGCQAVITTAGSACPLSAATAGASTGALKSLQVAREAPGTSMTNKGTEVTGLTTFTTSQATLTSSLAASAGTYTAQAATAAASQNYGLAASLTNLAAACSAAVAPLQACTAVAPTCEMTGAYGVFGVIGYQPLKPMMSPPLYSPIPKSESMFANLAKFIMSEARADLFSPMGIASGVAIKFLLATNTALAAQIDAFLFTPMKRAIAWGVLSGLTFAASAATDNQIKKIEGNISKIDAILNSMYALANGVEQEDNTTVKNPKIEKVIIQNKNLAVNELKNQEVDLKAMGGGPLPCITGGDSANCPSFSEKMSQRSDVKTLPSFVQTQIGNISKLADGISGQSKLSASTLDRAQSLAGQANALRKMEADKRKQLQASLKARGIKRDLTRDAAKFEATMKAAVQKELDNSRMSAADMLASFGGGRGAGSGSSSAITAEANKENADKDQKGKKEARGEVVVIANAPAANDEANLSAESDEVIEALGLDEFNAVNMDTRGLKAADGSALPSIDEYDLGNDINQDDGDTIFVLISNRYQKSGYPRLFNKKIKEIK